MDKGRDNSPVYAPGIDDQEELTTNADREEVGKGEYTRVTTLSFDEADPSK